MTKDVQNVETASSLPAVVALLAIRLVSAGVNMAKEPARVGTCAQPESTKSAATVSSRRSIRDIRSDLRRFHDESRSQRDVPPTAARNLTELKHARRDLIVGECGSD